MSFCRGLRPARALPLARSFSSPSSSRAGFIVPCLTLVFAGLLALAGPAAAQISFSSSGLTGETLSNPTSLDWGPDDRLYVAQQNGSIFAYTIQRNAADDYQVLATEQIDLVKNIPNHNDDGAVNSGESNRQVTGILAVGTTTNPVLYVTSSDPRIGAGGGGNDLGLDTNSGIISRLTWNGSVWDHVQIVRGLPRSEENHASNGMQLDPVSNTLYVMSGGHDNKGAPSNNFAATPEYALSAAMLSVDLTAIEAMPTLNQLIDGEAQYYIYDIPTLDDPTVAGNPEPHDPFGGNDGRNQARIVPGGPVQVYAPGFRNPYDVVLTQAGELYTFDNGPNTNWGGLPVGEGPAGNCTNEINESGSQGYGDALHHVTGLGYYGGHPHPTRANPEDSDLVIYENQGGWVEVDRYDWEGPEFGSAPPVPLGTGDAQQCDYLIPVTEDGALVVINSSTNGMDEYTASNFGGVMQGDLLAAAFNGNVYRFELNAAGDTILNGGGNGEVLLTGFGSQPLDVVALGDSEPFPGVIIAATYGADNITVFEPNDFLQCAGTDDPGLDEDGDLFDNADEIDNGTNPCSAGSLPPDADGDFESDLNDPDDDNDGTPDISDPFAIDPDDGTTTSLPIDYPLFNAVPGTGFFGLGFTGLMTNGTSDYLGLFDPAQLAAGGAAGLFTVEQVSAGDAYQANNDQDYAFQFGVDVDTASGLFTVQYRVLSPFFSLGGGPSTPVDFQSFGGYIGDGTQDDYLKIVVEAAGGAGGVQVLKEEGGVTTAADYGTGAVGDVLNAIFVDLYLTVDAGALTVQPSVSLDGGTIVALGSPVPIPAAWLSSADSQGMAVGVLSTSFGSGATFSATWDFIDVRSACSVDADCDDGNSCTVNACSAGICQSAPEPPGTSCNEDADLCTVDTCDGAGLCAHDSDVSCGAGELCEPTTGLCEVIPTDDDNDGLIAKDPCPADARNACYGNVAQDTTTGSDIRINTSGSGTCAGARTDCNGNAWVADFGSNTGNTTSCSIDGGTCPISGIAAILGCTPNADTEDIFQCERWDPTAAPELLYDFDLADGEYLVNLYFANTYSGTAAVGSRVFDINIEGALVYGDFDQVAAAGASQAAVVRSAVVGVSDGNGLQIELLHVTENPAIKGIEVLASGACLTGADCDDGDDCTTDVCNASNICQNDPAPDGTGCDDGLSCTGADQCSAGVCGGNDLCNPGEFCSISSGICQPETVEALVAVTPGALVDASTYAADAFQISNDSANGQEITQVSFDLSTALFPDIVFDPTDGTPAGDVQAKCLVPIAADATATGYVVPLDPCVHPFSGPNENGFYTITLSFSDFQPAESFSFSVDVDPTSIQGAAGSGAAGAVSGLELTGSSVQVTFDGSSTHTASLFQETGTTGGSVNIVKPNPPAAPAIEVLGVTTPSAVTVDAQTVRVSGTVGDDIRLLQVEGVMELVLAAGFDIEPFEANTAVVVTELSGTIGASGYVDFPVTLTQTIGVDNSDEGLNHFVVVVVDGDGSGRTGTTSDVLVVRYDPNACSVDLDCDDGLFCNGAEICNLVTSACEPGLAPAGDGVACTDDVCDEVGDVVVSTPNDANCDDGLYCNGAETCDAALDCQSGSDPCLAGEYCDEALDMCLVPCPGDADCDTILDGDDPCPADAFNMCGGALTALCTAATGNCGAIDEAIAYDAGPGAPTTACDGSVWTAETGVTLGSNYGGNVTIDGPSVSAVFGCTGPATETLVSSERYDATLTRSYPIANGEYSVSLLFAEAFQNNCDAGVGERIMDVSIEGIEVLSDFDVFATAQAENGVGCGSLVVRSSLVSVVDGSLDVVVAADVASVDANANLKAIKVVDMLGCGVDADCDDGSSCTADVCASGICQWTQEADGTLCDDGDICSIADVCTAGVCGGTVDSDGDGLGDALEPSCQTDPCPGDALNACVGTVAVDGLSGQDIRVNAGPGCSVDFQDCRGEQWYADFGAQTNISFSTCNLPGGCPVDASPVFGCTSPETAALFQCEHYDGLVATPDLVYDFDVADGSYLVHLLFMNGFDGTQAPGARLFDVSIEGAPVLTEFDQVAEAVGSLPLVRAFPVEVSDGDGLQIELLHGSIENPAIKGIEVRELPEPRGLLLLAAGTGLLMALSRRRQR